MRVHSDAAAARSANALQAHSYTIGDQIVFAEGRYRPGTAGGMRLLAHELAHVVQQRWGGSQTGQAHESDADRAATTASSGHTVALRTGASVGIALQPAGGQQHSVWDTFKPGGAVFEALDSVANPKHPVAKGVMDNLYKRGEALVNAPAAVANLYEKEGPVGVGKAVVTGVGNLVKDTGEAAGDITWEATHYQGPKSGEKIASRAVDVLLNTADLVTIAAGGEGAVKGGISGARAVAEGVKNGTTAISEGAKILRPALAVAGGGGIRGGEAALEATSTGARLGPPGLKALATPPVLTSMAVKGTGGAAEAPKGAGSGQIAGSESVAEGSAPGQPAGRTPVRGPGPAPAAGPTGPAPSPRVWVNTDSGVYHAEGSPFFSATKQGRYMTQAQAEAAGYRAAKQSDLSAAQLGTAEHARMTAELRQFEGVKLDNGWEMRKVERTVGGTKRIDQLWVHEGDKKVAVTDYFTGRVEPAAHYAKGMNYQFESEVQALLDKGYTYEYHPVVMPGGKP